MRIAKTAPVLVGAVLCGSLPLGVVGTAVAAGHTPAHAAPVRAADPMADLTNQLTLLGGLSKVIAALGEVTKPVFSGNADPAAVTDMQAKLKTATGALIRATRGVIPPTKEMRAKTARVPGPDIQTVADKLNADVARLTAAGTDSTKQLAAASDVVNDLVQLVLATVLNNGLPVQAMPSLPSSPGVSGQAPSGSVTTPGGGAAPGK